MELTVKERCYLAKCAAVEEQFHSISQSTDNQKHEENVKGKFLSTFLELKTKQVNEENVQTL